MTRKGFRSLGAAAAILLLVASGAFAAMGNFGSFTFSGFGSSDMVGAGENSTPDGKADAQFAASITGAGALAGLSLKAPDGSTWDTTPGNSAWGMRVRDNSGNVLVEANGRMGMVPFLMGIGVEISVADNGAIAKGGNFTLTARFMDNSTATSTVSVPASISATTASIGSLRWAERQSRDIVGQGEAIRGDGKPDIRARVELNGSGTLVEAEVRNLVEGNPTSVWDTVPNNGRSALGVSRGRDLLNNSNGSIEIPVSGRTVLDFAMADNGTLTDGKTRFEVILRFADGKVLRGTLPAQAAQGGTTEQEGTLEAKLAGEGSRDLVGKSEKRAGNGNSDWRVNVKLDSPGTVTGLTLRNVKGSSGEWDTIAGNGKWLMAVTKTNGEILNRSDGTVRLGLTGPTELVLWVEDNGSLGESATRSRLVVQYDDGRTLEADVTPFTSTGQQTGDDFLQAALAGEGNRDIVGKSEKRAGNGTNDWRVDLKLDSPGTITGMKVANVKGGSGQWDTQPNNGKWLAAVTKKNGEILNRSDGSVRIPISGATEYILWLEDNGSLGKSDTRSRLTVLYDDGRTVEADITPYASSGQTTGGVGAFEAVLAGVGNYDYVSDNEELGSNMNRDYRFDVKFEEKGTLTGVRLANLTRGGEWDTVPNNGKWLLAVTRPGGKVLNSSNGSVRIPVEGSTSLQLWVEDNGTLADPSSKWRVTFGFSDGRLVEKEIGATAGGTAAGRTLTLSKPWQATSDFVGPYDGLRKNKKNDVVFSLKANGSGTITALTLTNIGVRGVWDTVPGNGRWSIAVRAVGGGQLNRPNGSISIPVPKYRNLQLFVENNGTLLTSKSRYELVATWSDGTRTVVRVP